MRFVSLLPLLILVTGCAGRSASVPSTVLASADPSAPETPYTQPADPTGGEKPRTLELEIQTKPAGADDMKGMEGMDHSQQGGAAGKQPTPAEATVYTCPMHPEIREAKPGKCPKCGMTLVPAEKKATPKGEDHSKHGGAAGASPTPTAKPTATAEPAPSEATVYTCPMHPEIRESKPGKCPKCGMTLVPAEKKKETEKAAPAATAAPKASPEATTKPSGHEGHGGMR